MRPSAAALLLILAVPVAAQEVCHPVVLDQLVQWMRLAEAEKPSEEIAAELKRLGADFRMQALEENAIRQAAASSRRPADLVRQVVQAADESWIFERIKTLAKTPEGPAQIARLVLDCGVEIPYLSQAEDELRRIGAREPVLMLLWPPDAPPKPRFAAQEWRLPKQNAPRPPLEYNPDAPKGSVEMDVHVDGKVMIVLKHTTIFYNAVCGQDLQLTSAVFSSPLPRLPLDRWDYRLEFKGRGYVYACPADKRCAEGSLDKPRKDKHCVYEDLVNGVDNRGFANPRFVIDDHQSGSSAYHITLRWALRPYTSDALMADLKQFGPVKAKEKIYGRGVAFRLDPQLEEGFRRAGANQRMIDEIKRNLRQSNW